MATHIRDETPGIVQISCQQPFGAAIQFDLQDGDASQRVTVQHIEQGTALGMTTGKLAINFHNPGPFLEVLAQGFIQAGN
jgi:hypothetical protein